jgi:hypothetical protein
MGNTVFRIPQEEVGRRIIQTVRSRLGIPTSIYIHKTTPKYKNIQDDEVRDGQDWT